MFARLTTLIFLHCSSDVSLVFSKITYSIQFKVRDSLTYYNLRPVVIIPTSSVGLGLDSLSEIAGSSQFRD